MKALGSIDRALFKVELTLLTTVLASMVGLACLQIILRNFFSTGIISAEIVLRHLTLGLTFLGASLATREGRHLKIDIVPRIVSKRLKGLLGVITGILSATVCVILARAGWNFSSSNSNRSPCSSWGFRSGSQSWSFRWDSC